MVQGCTSHAGKSYLASALCRLLADEGLRVAPFKAQNMSNNAGVTADGRELGRAQIVQAAAARIAPEARMNPVLVKPEADTRSQVVVLGEVDHEISRLPWRERRQLLWPVVRESLHGLLDDYDVVVIEGAGSPAEINLRDGDIVNMAVALEVSAPVLLCCDIDRGGAFAHLLGTWHCLAQDGARRCSRASCSTASAATRRCSRPGPSGSRSAPACRRSACPVDRRAAARGGRRGAAGHGARVRSRSSRCRGSRTSTSSRRSARTLRYVRTPEELEDAATIVIPGTKATLADLDWLRSTGLAGAIARRAAAGVPVLGICGGLQMLGRTVRDPLGVEGGGEAAGLGLLDLVTELRRSRRRAASA